MKWVIAFLLLLCGGPAFADSESSADMTVTGAVGVGTVLPRARLDLQMAASDNYVVRLSSPDGTSMLVVDKTGKLGLGVVSPQARLDAFGAGDAMGTGLLLRVGNSSSTTSSSQLVFAYDSGATYRHSIRTRHAAGQNDGNSIDFFLFRSTVSPGTLGSFQALSLQNVASASTGAVHIVPYGTPDVELEVSSGTVTGGGRMHRASAGTHSSRALKTGIAYLERAAEAQAYADVKVLRHAAFRYKGSSERLRGLIYEDAPESIRGEHKTIILDDRVANLELALKEANRKIEEIESKIVAAKMAGGRLRRNP